MEQFELITNLGAKQAPKAGLKLELDKLDGFLKPQLSTISYPEGEHKETITMTARYDSHMRYYKNLSIHDGKAARQQKKKAKNSLMSG